MIEDINNNIEKESQNSNINTDNSYTVIENILYCSSAKRGIKSKSNVKNKDQAITPFTANSDMQATYFTFNIFREPSTDVGSKEEIINNKKNSNIISEFSILNLKQSKFNNLTPTKIQKEEKENEKNIKEEIEKECFEKNSFKKKYKSRKKNNKYNYFSSKLDETNQSKSHRNSLIFVNRNENKENKLKKKSCRYSSIDSIEYLHKKCNKNKNYTEKVKRYSSVNFTYTKKKKKTIKSHFYEDNLIKERERLKEIKDKHFNENKKKSHKDKEKHLKNKKINKGKIIISKSLVFNPLKIPQYINEVENRENKFKLKILHKIPNSKSHNEDNENNFDDKKYISHPIKINKEKLINENNNFFVKSTKYMSQRQYLSIKEIDRAHKKHTTEIKKAKKGKSCKKNNKRSKKHNTLSKKKSEKKDKYEVSDFCENNEENRKKSKIIKNLSLNIFRKSHNKNEFQNENGIQKSKKSNYFIDKNKDKDKQYKLKSSMTLNKNERNRKSIPNTKCNQDKKQLRRHTIFRINDIKKIQNFNQNNKSISKEKDSFNSNKDEKTDNGYEDDCSSKNESIEEKKNKMKIGEIREDKLILNYKNKSETIEVLSDKENIDNYYEYLEICLETLQEINLEEVPKSKANIDFKFQNEKKKKKIALFDLDETLVHCIGEIKNDNYDNPEFKDACKIKVILPCKKEVTIGINVRPHLKELLDKVKEVYNIVIFTASHRSYSDAVLNYLDPEDKYFHYRLYRDSCVQYKKNDINFYVKDLDIFKDHYNLKDIIIIDNSILSFAYHLNNGVPVVPFYDSKQDSELPLLCFYLLSIANYNDLREANKEHIKIEYFLAQTKNEISLDEETLLDKISSKDNKNDNIINSIKNIINNNSKINLNDEIKNNNKDYEVNNNMKLSQINLLDIKEKKKIICHKSEKILVSGKSETRTNSYRKKFHTVKLESTNIMDFFEKWKNAYLQLALKK